VPQGKSDHVIFRNETAKGSKPPTLPAVIIVLFPDEGTIEAFKVGASK
jgi:hypothetical protein